MSCGLALSICFFLSCRPGTPSDTEKNSITDWDIPMADEDQVIVKHSPFLVTDAMDSISRENNELINWVIDNSFDLERTSSGIFYHIIDPGSENKSSWGDRVQVHYRGFLLDGSSFDSTYERGSPFTFYIGNVINGWNQALPLLGEGGKGIFIIPSHLAYGHKGFGDLVGPHEHLRFDIWLISVLDEDQ